MATIPDDVWQRITNIVALLARGDLDSLEATGETGRCRKDDLRRRIAEYGRTLVALPAEARAVAEAFDRPGGEILADVPLWTAEEGRSDLTLQVVGARSSGGTWTVVIHDLLVP
jgi:hypothetical protein